MLKRLFPMRWAKIVAWTGAALAWGTTAIAVASNANATATSEQPAVLPAVEPPAATSTTTTTVALVPELPERGLVVIRYTPFAPPPPEVAEPTAAVARSSGNGPDGGKATPAPAPAAEAPAPAPAPAAEAPAPAPAPAVEAPVQSSGS